MVLFQQLRRNGLTIQTRLEPIKTNIIGVSAYFMTFAVAKNEKSYFDDVIHTSQMSGMS